MSDLREKVFYVQGMHCASCEVLIENKLLEIKSVKSVDVSATKGQVVVEYEGEDPDAGALSQIFKENGYEFSDEPFRKKDVSKIKKLAAILGVSVLLISAFLFVWKSGVSSLVQVNAKSGLPAFFVLGLLAGVSSCAALVGGLVLSMSKQWERKTRPHVLFNAGRLVSYAFFGAILGIIGQKLQISLAFSSVLVMLVSLIMILMALQMLGLKFFRRFQITLPKFMLKKAVSGTESKKSFTPFLLGAVTFFLPCGFTLTAQGLALLSGSALLGGLMMFLFALGTLPSLLLIGFSSIQFLKNPRISDSFLKVAAILVLFFALFNVNAQLIVLGVSTGSQTESDQSEEGLVPIVNGQQVLKMTASASGYKPNYFKVRSGIPVRWEIEDAGTSGCTNAVISRNLFDGAINLTLGQTSVKEFTPLRSGKYRFSCWMGMISGTIEVI